ncbi:MAG: hypothetical protein KDC38_10000 [Planctomycetes bacterium]|nr:hypothetical protein [Planctomycetota bacterium]
MATAADEEVRGPEPEDAPLDAALLRLEARLRAIAPVAVALSGGVDSSLLLAEAHRVLGAGVVAVTGVSASLGAAELTLAREIAADVGVDLIELPTSELTIPSYRANRGDRCFFCKTELYGRMSTHPKLEGYTLVDGTNADDRPDDRPGMRAARRWRVESPLRDAGLGKPAIRRLARERQLRNWDRPARPCLASRIAVGVEVDAEKLRDVEAMESVLDRHGFAVYRARVVDRGSGLEVVIALGREELRRTTTRQTPNWLEEVREIAASRGYLGVTLDPDGYRAPGDSGENSPRSEDV